MALQALRQTIGRHRITFGVILALVVGLLLTMVSMALYVSSGASRLDLSRPGYEKARSEITKEIDKTPDFSQDGPVNGKALEDFQKRFTKRRDELNSLGAFNSSALDDSQLQIAPAETAPVQ